MRGSINYQIQQVYAQINEINTSKHTAKELAVKEGNTTKHEIGKQMGIHSYATADAYRDVWRDFLKETKENFGVKNIENITGQHIQSYLESKIEKEIAHSTFMQYSAALEKLEVALNRYAEDKDTGKEYNFSENIANVREIAHQELSRFDDSRAYQDPEKLISNIQDERFKLAATLQYQSGLRLKELGELREKDGQFKVLGKGGKIREVNIKENLKEQVREYLKQNNFKFTETEKNQYRETLKQSALNTNQRYTGTHGLRWNYAQERFNNLQEQGKSYNESLVKVSQELGHERADITEHYLK